MMAVLDFCSKLKKAVVAKLFFFFLNKFTEVIWSQYMNMYNFDLKQTV